MSPLSEKQDIAAMPNTNDQSYNLVTTDPESGPQSPRSSKSSDSLDSRTPQDGVKRVEAISTAWSKTSLLVAYLGLYLMVFAVSLESQVTVGLIAFATSAFKAHSLVSTVSVVQAVFLSVVKPPMAKIADVFGRFEAFSISVFLVTIGYIMSAASDNVQTYAASAIFYSAGSTGLQVLQQIFIADTSNLLNRALCSTIPNIPYLINVWIGPPITDSILEHSTWRWGYGMWAIILPAAFIPLATSLFINQRKAAKKGLLPPSPYAGQPIYASARRLWLELDLFGLLLLSAAICLVLIPLTIAANASGGWSNPSIIAMLVVGGLCLIAFPLWERSSKFAPHAFFPRRLFHNRNVLIGVAIAFFYFSKSSHFRNPQCGPGQLTYAVVFYLSVYPYFNSYLLVVQNESVTAAGHITQTFTFTSTVTAIAVSLLIKYTKHYKYFVTLGACLYLVAVGLILRYRQEGVPTGTLVACQIALGIGGGLISVPTQVGVQAAVSHADVASATAIFLTILEIGGAVGSAISGAIWSHNILPKLEQYLPADTVDQAAIIYGNVTVASTTYAFGTPTRIAINRAYQETMTRILIVGICAAAPIVPLSLMMRNIKLDQVRERPRLRSWHVG